jgi:putative addiction module killer protein
MVHNSVMLEIVESAAFTHWIERLRDDQVRARIFIRIKRLAQGNPSDAKPVGGGISELRIHYGPGYRVYYMQRGTRLVVLLCGGNKSTLTRDIELAQRIAATWEV